MTKLSETPATTAPESGAAAQRSTLASAPWVWMIVACLLLGGAVGVRSWQNLRFAREEEKGIESLPFDLKTLPMTVGRFRAKEGIDMKLDPETVRYAGGLDHLVRTYTDEDTGIRLLVLVIYGRADRVVEHIPEFCYNGAGYEQVQPNVDVPIEFAMADGDKRQAIFRTASFTKTLGTIAAAREEAYYAFRYKERWSPENPLTGRNRRPIGIFKIQIQRPVAPTERQGDRRQNQNTWNPSEDFLAQFLPEFERTLAAATATTTTTTPTP